MSGATDYLTCGQCLKEFPLQLITLFIQHKKLDCDDDVNLQGSDPELQCNYCPQGFMTAWALLVHAQLTHNLKIFLEKASQTLLKEIRIPNTSSTLQIEHGDTSSPNFGNQPNSKTRVANAASVKNLKLEGFLSRVGDIPLAQTTLDPYQDKIKLSAISNNDAKGIVNTKPVNTVVLKDSSESYNTTETTKRVSQQSVCRLLSVSKASNLHLSPGQKLNIYPIKSADGVAIPKLGVIPLTFTSNPISSSSNTSIKVLSSGLLPTSVSESCSEVTHIPQNVLTLVKNDVSSPSVSVCRSGQTVFKIADTESKHVYQSPPKMESLTSQVTVIPTVSGFSCVNTAVSWPVPVTATTAQQEAADDQITDITVTESNEREAESQGHEEENADVGDDDDLDADSPACCDRQGCGVTVIPVSHEDLQKCCNAVVPKKRKRHMEQKHMPFSWSSSRYARRKMYNRSLMSAAARSAANQCQTNLSTAGTIYIDLEPDLVGLGERSAEGQDETNVKVTQSVSPDTRTLSSASTQIAQSRPHSLILKPGAVYSIPFTYTIPTTFSIPKSSTVPVAGDAGDSNSSSSFSGVGTSFTESGMSNLQDVSTDGNLDDHDNDDTKKRRHSSAKPFQCEKCTMAFNQRIHLKKHMSKHTGIKPYKCGECNYSTVERSHLKVHIRIHTGEKPFKCTYCEYATAQNSTLKIHLKRHHGGRMFQCKGCEKQFTQEEQLRGHEWEHGGKPSITSNTKEDADTSGELASTPGSTTTSSAVQEQNSSAASSLHSSPGMRVSTEASANQNEAVIETKTSPSVVANDDDEESSLL